MGMPRRSRRACVTHLRRTAHEQNSTTTGVMREWQQQGRAQVAKGASRAARALLRAGADPARPVRGATPREDALTLAAGAGRAELASALISAGAPPSGEAALLAARKGHLDVLWPVLDAARADDRLPELVAARNARGDTAVALLVARGDVDAAARLVADYRAPLADCSRDRKASLQRRTPLSLSQTLLSSHVGGGGAYASDPIPARVSHTGRAPRTPQDHAQTARAGALRRKRWRGRRNCR